jgi:hypothetical protein
MSGVLVGPWQFIGVLLHYPEMLEHFVRLQKCTQHQQIIDVDIQGGNENPQLPLVFN